MAGTPVFKIYDRVRGYVASVKDPADAAGFAEMLGEGCEVRLGHSKSLLVYTAGEAPDSYDEGAELIETRRQEIRDRIRRRTPKDQAEELRRYQRSLGR